MLRFPPFSYFLLVVLFSTIATGIPYKEEGELYDYDGDEESVEETELMQAPAFVSTAKTILVNKGDTIRLPCIVDRLEGFVMLWKKNADIIAVASQIIDKRVRLEEEENGNHLIMNQASPADEGDYTCQISAYKPTELTHTVKIRVKPEISTVPEQMLIVKAGDSATMTCSVLAGSPTPKVRWRRRDRKMPGGEEKIIGDTLTFTSVTRHHGGHYVCEADNGFGPEPVTKEIRLEVNYAPEIEQEQIDVHTVKGDSQELVCIVHAHPKAEVTWLRNGEVIGSKTPNVLLNSVHNRHGLTLLAITKDMLGQYECQAENMYGKQTMTVKVSGTAKPVMMKSSSESEEMTQHSLQWTAESKSPISEFKVSFQREGETTWGEHFVEDIQAVNGSKSLYLGHLELTGLEQATRYLVRVASSNSFGYNEPEHVFSFATKRAAPVKMHSIANSSRSNHSSSSFFLCLVFLLFRFI